MIGFHGCDQSVRDSLVSNPNKVEKSQKAYDWLGNGFYIWENNTARALKWAEDKRDRGEINNPCVVGVVYQLDYCLDLTDSEFIDLIAKYFDLMKTHLSIAGKEIPKNKDFSKDEYHDRIIRELDCAVIEFLFNKIEEQRQEDINTKGFTELRHFDTVRGIFTEGGPAFEGAGIQNKNHIQVSIRNLNCIKGFFIPRERISFP